MASKKGNYLTYEKIRLRLFLTLAIFLSFLASDVFSRPISYSGGKARSNIYFALSFSSSIETYSRHF